ncbi:MAG: class I SAM-dependent methyltransferase [Spirochaetota bacterium]
MTVYVNDTSGYHQGPLETLGWEVTVCNMLHPANSPCRKVLHKADSYGNLLYDFLKNHIPVRTIEKIVEIGGGYGNLMEDLLSRMPAAKATMIDISPALLEAQKDRLAEHDCEFILSDFQQVAAGTLRQYHLAVMNENAGDFPTLCNIPRASLEDTRKPAISSIALVKELYTKYSLTPPAGETFSFNLGAAMAMEKLAAAGIPFIFMSEHSCEASVTGEWEGLVKVYASDNPEKISLHGHDEYTIRFSDVEKVARYHGYNVQRGNFNDILHCELSPLVRFVMTSGSSSRDEHEIIRQFVEDVFKYEYILCVKK